MLHEAQMHEKNSFITLTYDKEHLPENGSLEVTDWQRFAKRLRHAIGPFRFFHCGEYGGTTRRPHYHACLFGANFAEDRLLLQSSRQSNLYTSPLLQHTWGMGHVTIGDVTYQSAAYVARYCIQKRTGPQAEHYYTKVDPNTGECWSLKPEYVTMSRNPGIGAEWYARYHAEVYPSDTIAINGRLHRPPRYYDEKLPEEALATLKAKRADAAALYQENLTPERLKVREAVATERTKQLQRDAV